MASLLASACLPLAWEPTTDAGRVGVMEIPPNVGGGLGGGFGGGGMPPTGGGFGGGGGGMPPPLGGGAGASDAGRPDVPVVTGRFDGARVHATGFPPGPLRSTSLAPVPGTSKLLVVVPESDWLYVLSPSQNQRLPLPTGANPSSVAVERTGQHAWVALRGLGAVARVTLDTGAVHLVDVGAQPTGVALSPSDRTAVVATFGERTLSLVDTGTLTVERLDVGGHPRAVAITDDGDTDDTDESAWVTHFFGELVSEATDDGRRGVVVEVDLATRTVAGRVTLAPLSTGRGWCSPNLLSAIALAGDTGVVTHTCAAPGAPLGPEDSLFAGLSTFRLSTRTELLGVDGGSRVLSAPMRRMPVPIDVTLGSQGEPIVLAQGSGEVWPLTPNSAPFSVSTYLGGPVADPVEGLVTGVYAPPGGLTFVLDATGRAVIELGPLLSPMPIVIRYPFETLPPVGSQAWTKRLGFRHFASAEGVWASDKRAACTSCHPDGLTDGLTWSFSAGPRQTLSLDGTWTRGASHDTRARGWTATADELSDVETLVRTVAGGTGALLDGVNQPLSLTEGMGFMGLLSRHDGLSGSSRELALAFRRSDWSEVEAWGAALTPPPGTHRAGGVEAARGRLVFEQAGCPACHGGPRWSVSRVPYTPSAAKNGSAVGSNGLPSTPTGLRTQLRPQLRLPWNAALNTDTFKVAVEERALPDGGVLRVGPERLTCVLRDVGTFSAQDPLEVKASGEPAQGSRGYNPPSLFGLATSAPYLHHGAAKTLTELFSPRFAPHYQARVPGFLADRDGGVELQTISDLVAFLESIDGTTPPFPLNPADDLCGGY